MAKLITFGDGNFGIRAAAKRLVRQGEESGYFSDGCERWDLARLCSLDNSFQETHLDFIRRHPKGLGFWIWQPAVLLNAMLNSPEGQVIVFLDAGCQIFMSPNAKIRMMDYLATVEASGYLFIQIKEGSFGVEDLSEKVWTKKSCIEFFNLTREQQDSTQIQSGVIMIANTPAGRSFVSRWYEYCIKDDYQFLVDASLEESQHPGFMSHRYAQSILSIMVKKEFLPCLIDETYWYPNWAAGVNFPIWTMRNRSGGDAFRRNCLDLIRIGLAKIERKVRL